jgi:hypothetical protein
MDPIVLGTVCIHPIQCSAQGMLATSPRDAGDRRPALERKRTRLNTPSHWAEQVLQTPMGQAYRMGRRFSNPRMRAGYRELMVSLRKAGCPIFSTNHHGRASASRQNLLQVRRIWQNRYTGVRLLPRSQSEAMHRVSDRALRCDRFSRRRLMGALRWIGISLVLIAGRSAVPAMPPLTWFRSG